MCQGPYAPSRAPTGYGEEGPVRESSPLAHTLRNLALGETVSACGRCAHRRRGRGARLRCNGAPGETASLPPTAVRGSRPWFCTLRLGPSAPLVPHGTAAFLRKSSEEKYCKHGVPEGSSCSIKMSFQCLKQKHGLNCKRIKNTSVLCCSSAYLLLVFSPILGQNGRISQMALLQH